MTSPNEPGSTTPSEPAGGSGQRTGEHAARPVPRPGEAGAPVPRLTESGEAPPWQRGSGRAQTSGPRPVAEPEARAKARVPAHTGPAEPKRPAADAEGARAEAGRPEGARPEPGRAEATRGKDFGSELPDLSGPRPVRKPAADREQESPRPAGRLQVGARSKTSGPVRASMQIRRIDPWSTLKVSLLLSVALFFVWMIAVAILYLVLGGMGVWTKLNSNVGDLLNSAGGTGGELVSAGSIFGGSLLIGLVNIVVLTALATIGAFVYNLSTDIVGGIEVTLADRD